MTEHDYKQNAYYLIYLIRCVLNDKIPAKEKLDKMDLSQLYEVAQSHSLTAITAYALESAGIVDKAFKEAKSKAIRKNILFDIEREKIFVEFDKNQIWYLPLKGIILKEYYPRIGMRQMSDNDILFDRSRMDDVTSIMKRNGFEEQKTHTGHDIVFHKKPVLNFEMHYSLFSEYKNSKKYNYFSDIFKRLIDSKGYKKEMSHEDFYLYVTTHEYSDYINYGKGLRSLVDAFVFLRKHNNFMDWNYLTRELNKLDLYDYEKNCRNLAAKLFQGSVLNQEEKNLLDSYIFSPYYGSQYISIHNNISKDNSNKLKYVFERFFLPLETVKNVYPFFYEHIYLVPILPAYRVITSLKRNKRRIITELKTLIKI